MAAPLSDHSVAIEIRRQFEASGQTTLEINQTKLAATVGLNRVTVNRIMQRMLREGLLVQAGYRRYQLASAAPDAPPTPPPASAPDPTLERLCALIEQLIERQNAFELFARTTLAELLDRLARTEERFFQALEEFTATMRRRAESAEHPASRPRPSKRGSASSAPVPNPEEFHLEAQSPAITHPAPPYERLQATWNEHAPKLPQTQGKVGVGRKKAIKAAWDDAFKRNLIDPYLAQGLEPQEAGLQFFAEQFAKANASAFLRGEKSNKNWRANLDWVLKPEKWSMLIDGVYESEENDDQGLVNLVNDLDFKRYGDALRQYGQAHVEEAARALKQENHRKPFVSQVIEALRTAHGTPSPAQGPYGETHLQRYDRLNDVPADFEKHVQVFIDAGEPIPEAYQDRIKARAAARAKDEAEGRGDAGMVINGMAERVFDDPREFSGHGSSQSTAMATSMAARH
jgi:hypothetical protein